MKSPIILFLVVVILVPSIGQNLSPSVPLVLLGVKLLALPLGVWVGLALAAGLLTAATISLLMPSANRDRTSKSRQKRAAKMPLEEPQKGDRVSPQTVYTPPREAFDPSDDLEVEYASVRPSSVGNPTPPTTQPSDSEVWDDEQWESQEPANGVGTPPESPLDGNRRVVEVRKDPISGDRQGSIYSYSYRSPEDLNTATPDFDDEEDEETVDLREFAPQSQSDPFPPMEVIDPILEPENPPEKRTGFGFGKKNRSAAKPESQNEDDWDKRQKDEEDDW